MKHKLLLDTNVILDFALVERAGRVPAIVIMQECEMAVIDCFVSTLSLKDIYYVMSKYAGEPAAREFIAALLKVFKILPVTEATCLNAIQSNETDFEDGLIRECAEAGGVNFIISRDKSAFKKSTIKRMSPQEYVDAYVPHSEVVLEA